MASFTQQTWQDVWPHHFLANLHDYAIFAIDPKGTLTSWHPGVKTLLRFERDAFVGQSIRLTFTEEDVQAGVPEREMEVAREQGRALDERWHLKADGSRFWAVGILAALRSESGELLGYTKIMRDFTERNAENEARRVAALHDRALAEAGRKLSTSLDYPATLQQDAIEAARTLITHQGVSEAKDSTTPAESLRFLLTARTQLIDQHYRAGKLHHLTARHRSRSSAQQVPRPHPPQS